MSETERTPGRVVIGGAGGFMGDHFVRRYRQQGREVVTIGRSRSDLRWGDARGISDAIDGASLVVGLAGKSVNCRYGEANRAEIFRSRLETTAELANAIRTAAAPPALWVNAATATIYRHAEDRPMTEQDGEIGRGFSVEVAKAWEEALFSPALPRTRRVALRTAIVLGHGGVLGPIKTLARVGLGGPQLDGWWPVTHARLRAGTRHQRGSGGGRQKFSWVHIDDTARIIDFLEDHPEIDGPVNASAPNLVENREFMATVRRVLRVPLGLPAFRWMLELGALVIRTETELVLKSRWVLPAKLEAAGFEFAYPELEAALEEAFGPRPGA